MKNERGFIGSAAASASKQLVNHAPTHLARMHTRTHAFQQICTLTHTHTYTHVHTHTCACAHTHTHTHIHTYTHIRTHTCMHGYTHTHIRTQIHTNISPQTFCTTVIYYDYLRKHTSLNGEHTSLNRLERTLCRICAPPFAIQTMLFLSHVECHRP
jgi:hypothetical protein